MRKILFLLRASVKWRGGKINLQKYALLTAMFSRHTTIQSGQKLPPDQFFAFGGFGAVDMVRLVVENNQIRILGKKIGNNLTARLFLHISTSQLIPQVA